MNQQTTWIWNQPRLLNQRLMLLKERFWLLLMTAGLQNLSTDSWSLAATPLCEVQTTQFGMDRERKGSIDT